MRSNEQDALHVDLGAGLGGWAEPFRNAPNWRSVGLDIRDDLAADVVGDIRQLPFDCSPTLLTMSPPCTEFARWMLPWLDEPNPSLELVEACLSAIDLLDPDWWVMENSRGLHMYWRESVTHAGPYYLWGHFPPVDWPDDLEPKGKTSGMKPDQRAEVPYSVALSLKKAVEWHL